jgi:plastocyanin
LRLATACAGAIALSSAVSTGSARRASGVIAGRILYRGQAPPPVFVPESGGASPVLRVDRESGGLQYAVVYVDATDAPPFDTAQGKRTDGASRQPVTVVQRGFIFDPPVVAVTAGQEVRFTNEDSSNHNVRSADPMLRNRFNAYTGAGQEYVHRFTKPPAARPIVLGCDIHEWMAGWVYVFDHAWFAVTDREGRFRIEGVPAGRHALAVRQPAGGLARELRVDVRDGGTAEIEVTFRAEELKK